MQDTVHQATKDGDQWDKEHKENETKIVLVTVLNEFPDHSTGRMNPKQTQQIDWGEEKIHWG